MSVVNSRNEGLPYLEIHGLSTLVDLNAEDVQPYCKLAGFNDGYIKSYALIYTGYKWKVGKFNCTTTNSECFSGKLLHEMFHGLYISCHGKIHDTGIRSSRYVFLVLPSFRLFPILCMNWFINEQPIPEKLRSRIVDIALDINRRDYSIGDVSVTMSGINESFIVIYDTHNEAAIQILCKQLGFSDGQVIYMIS
jgi:hypothetical protein